FFSSRRRHTRFSRDWSSDVCSSDLYCDSGMIPWLIVLQVMCETGKSLSQLVGERMRLFPASGEINRRVPDGPGTIAAIRAKYERSEERRVGKEWRVRASTEER